MARYAASDYAAAGLALLPRGRVWRNAVQALFFAAIGKTFERADTSGSNLLAGSLPGDNPDLILEWEQSLGLPDPCLGDDPTIDQRAAQIRARFIGGGGLSRQRYIDYAAALGFTITITNYAPFRCGINGAGDPVGGEAWGSVWGVVIVANTGGLPNDVLLCELNAIKPAETVIIFAGGDFLAENGGGPFTSETGDTFILEH